MTRDYSRQRAINFFTLSELLRHKQSDTTRLWRIAAKLVDVSLPWPPGIGVLLGRLGWDDAYVGEVQDRVLGGFQQLTDHDTVLERGVAPYPRLLASTEDAPEFLFVRGRLELMDSSVPRLAVVGTRAPTEEGARRARKLGYLLARRGIAVTSGLAKGIDYAAHRGALEIGGDTIAVLGTPINRVYPRDHNRLQELIGRVGLLVTQFPPHAPVRPYNFPLRNAMMSGICLGSIVVEASETSGALIQARRSLQQGRKLFIPQSAVDNPQLTWPKTYLDRGGIRFNDIEQILAQIDSWLPLAQCPVAGQCSLRQMTSKT